MGNAASQRIAIISPYLNTLGGGERFILTIAEYLSRNRDVVIFWEDEKIKADSQKKLGIDLSNTKIERMPQNSFLLIKKLTNFNQLFYMTDGSLFFSPCPDNFLIIQSPVHIPKKSFTNRIKLARFRKIICYSEFIKNYIKLQLKKKAIVIPPPVFVNKFVPHKKENLIISVGRFFPYLHSKKQEILVSAFREFYRKHKDWQLVLIGSVDRGAEDYFEKIKKSAHGYPIRIIKDADINELSDYYGRAKIYWHAAGYGEDLNKFPERAEHFGITTVEAMSAGCVPIVFEGGGQKEIVKAGKNGFLWTNINELVEKTSLVVIKDFMFKALSLQSQKDSKIFSKNEFLKKIEKLVKS